VKASERVKIESLGNRVGGIARPEDSPAVFVRGALPGEVVTIARTGGGKSFIEAELVSVDEPSPHRETPFCPHYGICGGCSLQHLNYEEELFWKRVWVRKALRGIDAPEPEHTLPSPRTRGYRNRVTFDVVDGILCLHGFRSDPVPIDLCPLMNSGAAEVLKTVRFAGLPPGLRKVSVRAAENTDDTAIELYGFREDTSGIPGSVFAENEGEWICLSGGIMHEKLNGVEFPVHPGSFFQVNTGAAELLVDTVLKMIDGDSRHILDLYGGTGTFGVPLALRGLKVDSVEMNTRTSQACGEAALLNKTPGGSLRTVNMSDRSYLAKALKTGKYFDSVIVDPPRAGMGIRTARQIRHLCPPRIVYVSCNPFSAARDISILLEDGYSIKRVVPVDMFPNTDHVEAVFLIEGR